MKINQVFKAFDLCKASNVTPALVGTSGAGKTTIAKQYAKEREYDTCIVLRPSIIADVGDLVGLPNFEVLKYEVNGETVNDVRTTFRAPDWLPKGTETASVVIDDINRARPDVMMALFDLIEAEQPRIGKFVLPEGSFVVSTLNPPTDEYQGVTDFNDSAFISRMCFLKIEPDFNQFKSWGKKKDGNKVTNLSHEMISFLENNNEFFGLGEDFEVEMFGLSENMKNNSRSKKKINDLYVSAKELKTPKGILGETIRGIGGKEFAVAFLRYADEMNTNISLEQILKDKKILEKFNFDAMSNINQIIEKLKEYTKTNELKDFEIDSVVTFFEGIPLDTYKAYMGYFGKNPDEFKKDTYDRMSQAFIDNTYFMDNIEYLKLKEA